ncbi:MAG: YjgP/YjgQ family permease [Campylobacter sp.]|nr:YjgP/YjgQ family permease [Campylobacter sp.]
MNRVSRYLFSNFISSFVSLFSVLFFIVSIVFFIRISRITAYIEVDSWELLKLYLFMLPRVLIFTGPIAFFVSLAVSFYRLSKDNESTVIFTFGYSPLKISSFFIKIAALISLLSLIIGLVLMPYAENLRDNFTEYKKTQATLNLRSSEFGQTLDDWLVFIEDDERQAGNTLYKNIILYKPLSKDEEERVILAKEALFRSIEGIYVMTLMDGIIYTLNSEVHITEFDEMSIKSKPKQELKGMSSVFDYWSEIKTSDRTRLNLSIYSLVSLFPLASVLFALSFGIVTYRYEKGLIYVGIFTIIGAYFAAIMLIGEYPFVAVPVIFLLTLIASIFYFKYKILRKY